MSVYVIAYDTANPGDTSNLMKELARFEPSRVRRLALLVKTEGNSEINDFSREYAMLSAEMSLANWGGRDLIKRTTSLFSTGCEGAMTPFGYLFVDEESGSPGASADKRLVIGCARSRSLTGSEIGTPAHADIVTHTVQEAMRDAAVGVDDVALVIVKTPVMSHVPSVAPTAGGSKRITSAYSKAVGALGAGVALGEVDRSLVVQDSFDVDHNLYARRAMVFSGSELDCVEIMLLANRAGAGGDLRIETGQLTDCLDTEGLKEMLSAAGCAFDNRGRLIDSAKVVAMLIKAGIAPNGSLRGCRTTIKTSHIDMDKHVRATIGGIAASIVGSCKNFISANTIHQAPPGGGLCACIVRAP